MQSLKFRVNYLAWLGLLASSMAAVSSVQAATTYTGVAAGDANENSVILWTRTSDAITREGIVDYLTVEVADLPSFPTVLFTYKGTTKPQQDYTLKLEAKGLQSNTRYYYRFRNASNELSPVGTFKTAPKPQQKVPVRFAFSGDTDGKWRPYGLVKDFDQLKLDFFVFLGDTIYETKTDLSPATADPLKQPQQALEDYWRKYRENLEPVAKGEFPGLQALFAAQGNYTLLDNHELGNKQFVNGGAPTGIPAGQGVDATDIKYDVNQTNTFLNKTLGFKTLLQAYSNYQPIRDRLLSAPKDPRSDKTQQLYFAQQWGANAIFINVDDRSYRDIRLKTPQGKDDTGVRADNPNRTMLGKTQLQWLKQTLWRSQAQKTTWKIIAISSTIDEQGEENGKSWSGGYRAERNEILKFIAEQNIRNVVFLSTDDHQNRINELTYTPNLKKPNERIRVPYTFTIVGGPLGAGGPDGLKNRDFKLIKFLADNLVKTQIAKNFDPLGLDPQYPGLQNVFREGDPQADQLRQPVDFFTPNTFNYVTLEINAAGDTLAINTYGINAYAANTFPTSAQVGPVRRILGFELKAF